MDRGRLIGRDGDLPWRLPNDLKHFKQCTLGKTVLMGRRTFASLGRPLPQRDNWVLTRDRDFRADGVRVFHALADALAAHHAGELMVIGGAELYRQALPLADRIYLTEVDAALEGDTRFPALAAHEWREVATEPHPADARHAYAYCFKLLERRG
ncbi:dihydrofolate reductase [Sinimarinibacterium sp. HSW-8]|uniref:Dihydrofolate reductase n=2 Tax=Sinimarinibacterium thermocellulolyticum TaxID=3170016 RepID=A0ABV2A6J6_9GAMM